MYKKYKLNPKTTEICIKYNSCTSQLFQKNLNYIYQEKLSTYYSKAKGINVLGIDKKKYLDCTMVGSELQF